MLSVAHNETPEYTSAAEAQNRARNGTVRDAEMTSDANRRTMAIPIKATNAASQDEGHGSSRS